MKKFLAILRIGIFVILSIIAFLSWKAFSIWADDSTLAPVTGTLSHEHAFIGETVTLTAKVRLPYHQSPSGVPPFGIPEQLVIRQSSIKWTRGNLTAEGSRNWTVQLDAVLLSEKTITGKSISFSLKNWQKPQKNNLRITLPAINVTYTEQIPEKPPLTTSALAITPPTPIVTEIIQTEQSSRWWIIAIISGIVVISILVYLLIRRLRRPVKPWVKAQLELDQLKSADLDLPALYTKLADVLKSYTGSRFNCSAQASCTNEFSRLLIQVKHESLTDELCAKLNELLRQADAIRFAHESTSHEQFVAALAQVSDFVQTTIPTSSANHEPA